jgi:hypothetical protein
LRLPEVASAPQKLVSCSVPHSLLALKVFVICMTGAQTDAVVMTLLFTGQDRLARCVPQKQTKRNLFLISRNY